ncbi:succinate dehydrogenase, hydrophobic membrane anchor protein [Permianibacter aggregans]|uniref:Succinate dehydrogenase hydrophobic membrane anchor subunit n=1 Tax=Permianibacter aggregans TaxID=1510150 RepID=A0A4V3D6W7_9GAMM|nr:succinate dehydrogenase, hydrophobic membrane anchor protein [Permianibacter aggregans]QGX38433.1 succinate dehydrogenase, hydrophobic membrane anchor protein [Permianibacter aggregans]TDQ45547.1 succinate dehydrogenase subunit D [Permianibacter aggregans]
MVRQATTFGRSGLHDWVVQRLSAVVLLAYALYVGGYLLGVALGSGEMTHGLWLNLFTSPIMKIATMIAVFAVVAHAWIGIWTVLTDYVKPVGVRFVAQSLLIVTCLGLLLWGLVILWGV